MHKILQLLFDSGGSLSLIHERVMPQGISLSNETSQLIHTIAGTYSSHASVMLYDLILPEFNRSAHILQQKCQVFNGLCTFDVILGRDFLRQVGLTIDFVNNTMSCMDMIVPMHPLTFFDDGERLRDVLLYFDAPMIVESSYALEIKAAEYNYVNIDTVVDKQIHLTTIQRSCLRSILVKYQTLFDGKLKVYPHKQVHLELLSNAVPRHQRAYPVAHIHLEVFKTELQRLCDIVVLRKCGASKWASPTFIIPKTDGGTSSWFIMMEDRMYNQ